MRAASETARAHPVALLIIATALIAVLTYTGVLDGHTAVFLFLIALILAAALSGKELPFKEIKDTIF